MMLSKLCLLASSVFSSFRDPSKPAVYTSSIPKSRHRRVILNSKQFLMSFVRCHRVTRKMVVQSAIISSLSILILFFVIYAVVVSNFAVERAEEWAPRLNRRHWKAKHDEVHIGEEKRGKPWDFNGLVTQYTATPPCNAKTRLLILITSAPENYKKRQSIRDTWCSQQEHHQCVFLLGRSNVSREVVSYQDILQGTFVDSYRNLTLKVLNGFYWASQQCTTPPYVLKTDDDCFVNINLFLSLLRLNPPSVLSPLYMGRIFMDQEHLEVIRDVRSKWAVSWAEYFPSHYPPYASGSGYLLSQTLVKNLITESRQLRPFPNEDAYIGVLTTTIGVHPIDSARFTQFNIHWTMCNFLYLLVIHRVTPDQHVDLTTLAADATIQCKDLKFITAWE